MQHRRILFRMQQTVQMMGIGIGNRSSGRVRAGSWYDTIRQMSCVFPLLNRMSFGGEVSGFPLYCIPHICQIIR